MLAYLIIFPVGLLLMARIVRNGVDGAERFTTIEGGRPRAPFGTLAARGQGGIRP
jgi:hypothetical protein